MPKLKIGDVVIQHENGTLWFMMRKWMPEDDGSGYHNDGGPQLYGYCIKGSPGGWSEYNVGDKSPFVVGPPLDDGAEIIGRVIDIDAAIAAAALGAFDYATLVREG